MFRLASRIFVSLGASVLAASAIASGAPVGIVGDAKQGADKAAVCAACHAVDGNSTIPENPKLAGQHALYTAHQLALFKNGGRENAVMLGFASALSEQDMADIGAYFQAQKSSPAVADPELAPKGQALYRGGDPARGIPACMACHGPAGEGMPGPSYPALAGQHNEYTESMLKRFREGAVFGDPKVNPNAAVMAHVAKALTDQEIQALASYLEGQYRPD
jgi:cytochrome c553